MPCGSVFSEGELCQFLEMGRLTGLRGEGLASLGARASRPQAAPALSPTGLAIPKPKAASALACGLDGWRALFRISSVHCYNADSWLAERLL